jgi:hypothetical protein
MRGLTEVELVWIEKHIERWIRFGDVVAERIIDRRRRIVGFAPGSVFAFVRWVANAHGTVMSRIDILRAVNDGDACSTVPHVVPGGEILLRLSGWPKVSDVLAAIDAVRASGVDPEDVCPDHWRHVMNRLAAGETPRRYSLDRHKAWLRRGEIET